MGTDALRFTLLVGSTPGADVNLSLKKVEANRNFANKVWNAGRFVTGALEQAPAAPMHEPDWTLADSWIWARMQALVREVERLFAAYQYGEAGRQIYEFFWGDFADWYLEIAKMQLGSNNPDRVFYTAYTLVRVFDASLRLLHPFTPFVTEELWGYLKQACEEKSPAFGPKGGNRHKAGWEEALITAQFPVPRVEEGWETQKMADFALVQEIVRGIRNLRAESKVQPNRRIPAVLACGDRLNVLRGAGAVIAHLANLDPEAFVLAESLAEKPQPAVSFVIAGVEIYLPLAGMVDSAEERARLEKELGEITSQIQRLETLLGGSFADKAPAAVVERERQKLTTYRETAARLEAQIQNLK
jgi:valyl-tRNA synthetase